MVSESEIILGFVIRHSNGYSQLRTPNVLFREQGRSVLEFASVIYKIPKLRKKIREIENFQRRFLSITDCFDIIHKSYTDLPSGSEKNRSVPWENRRKIATLSFLKIILDYKIKDSNLPELINIRTRL